MQRISNNHRDLVMCIKKKKSNRFGYYVYSYTDYLIRYFFFNNCFKAQFSRYIVHTHRFAYRVIEYIVCNTTYTCAPPYNYVSGLIHFNPFRFMNQITYYVYVMRAKENFPFIFKMMRFISRHMYYIILKHIVYIISLISIVTS